MLDSPAIAIVGRHNSGKTTLAERLIACLTQQGLDIGSVKHHGHAGFDIDIEGKDSYRHRVAGATETYIAAPGQVAMVSSIDGEMECTDLVRRMPGHDLVIVEGYRNSGLPVIEIMRAANERDELVAQAFDEASRAGVPLSIDFVQAARNGNRGHEGWTVEEDLAEKAVGARTVAVVTDIPLAVEAAKRYGIPAFGIDDIESIATFVRNGFARPRMTVAIQAGGESKRMGQSKALVPFCGKPLITRLVQRLSPAADELIITTNEPQNLQFLFDEFPHVPLRLVRDDYDQRGALPGLCTAFNAASNPIVAIVACDMIHASARLIAAEYQRLVGCGADACVPCNSHGFEPFHAVYRREACLAAAQRLVAEGQQRAQSMFSVVRVEPFSQQDVLDAEPRGCCFINANTPEELADAERAVLEGR
ncbi:MAG: molybdopterin-guanine dinucleotide biosynthesis protein B [Eggerthellaceae bacterium]|nr:molybdopterin-guanine dinucleotide biosynthesis protein B [Eggerthellaceae bacterium]